MYKIKKKYIFKTYGCHMSIFKKTIQHILIYALTYKYMAYTYIISLKALKNTSNLMNILQLLVTIYQKSLKQFL